MPESVRAIPGLLDAVAKAIYGTHIPEAKVNRHLIPTWENASDPIRGYVRRQVMSATEVVDEYRQALLHKRPPRDPGTVRGNPALIEAIAKAIYRTHGPDTPDWKRVTEELREWHRAWALSIARTVDDYIAQHARRCARVGPPLSEGSSEVSATRTNQGEANA